MMSTGISGETLTVPKSTTPASTETHYQDLVVGCLLAICGNLLISISLNMQKYTHMKNEEREVQIHYTRNPLWWVGVSLMIIGEIGNFSAYGYAPASLVAPLGTTTVVANMFLAAIFLKEKIGIENLCGSALAVIGAILVVAFAPKKEKVLTGDMLNVYLTDTSFIVYICIELAILVGLFLLLYVYKVKRVVVYLSIVSVIASFSVISAKAVSSLIYLTFAGDNQLQYFTFYLMTIVMFSTAILQVKYLNMAMQKFESTIVVPTNFVFFTISAIIAGIVFYKEFWGMSPLDIIMFLFGCVMSFVGVYFIVVGRPSVDDIKKVAEAQEGAPPVSIASRCFPAWLLATINVGKVQPSGSVSHLITEDEESRRPFVAADGDTASNSSQEILFTFAPEQNGSVQYTKTYESEN
ncbi:NIPA-like protein 2 isoform X2 [Mercenaria mercenaria]|uniref:NIPA-like protein 2 isoform X2 n=1 Tax=Mercenaria mercenaria TaxID=6596 RepID=UPI00234F106D|nr:NIPA-like protein 2 isoform X2 [Mercenaria mercenaria]